MKIKILFISIAFIFSVNAKIEIHQEILINGLKVIIVPMKSNEVVRLGIVYNVGSADDPMCKIGLSHFLEHMMFKGTKTHSGPQFKQLLDKYSMYTNATTSQDYTVYFHSLHKDFLETILKLEADRMINLKFDNKDVESERNVVADERNMRCDSDPEGRHIADTIQRAKYLHSNYGINAIGYPQHIKNYSKKALIKHYRKFYKPNNATIIVVGDVSITEVVDKIKATFNRITVSSEAVKRNRVLDPTDLNLKHSIERSSDQIKRSTIEFIYTFDRKHIDSLRKMFTLDILNICLGANRRSILYQELVEKKQAVYSVSSGLETPAFDKCFFSIFAHMKSENDDKNVEKQISDIVNNLIPTYLTKELFEKVKNTIFESQDLLLDNPGDMFLYIINTAIALGYNLEDVKNLKEIITQITFEELQKMAKEILIENNKVCRIYIHPDEEASKYKDQTN
ncbi:MAG: insulinase family protein [Holosporales bacterium]|jgi:zinc protease|nr:insulinase family protein [Holosporales bacterium]